MKLTYIPAYMPISFKGYAEGWKGHSLFFWEDSDYIKVDKILISAAFGMEHPDFVEKFNLQNIKILGDSGGFQNLTGGLNLDPIKVLKWQEKYCAEGLTFDEPPTKFISGGNFEPLPLDEYKEKIKISILNGINMLKNKTNPNFKLLLVVHGIDYESLNYNLEYLKQEGSKLDDFDGISISYKTSNIYNITEQMFWLMENAPLNKRVHFLGTSSKKIFYLIKYILFDREDIDFTFDSSSYSGGAQRRTYFDSKLNSYQVKTEDIPEKCNCSVCKENDIEIYKRNDLSIAGWLLSLHNLNMFLDFFHKDNHNSRESIIKYLEDNNIKDILKGINYYERLKQNKEQALKLYIHEKELIPKSTKTFTIYDF